MQIGKDCSVMVDLICYQLVISCQERALSFSVVSLGKGAHCSLVTKITRHTLGSIMKRKDQWMAGEHYFTLKYWVQFRSPIKKGIGIEKVLGTTP